MADTEAQTDFDHLLRSNLQRVFNERDAAVRAAAIAELYVADPVMYEPDKIVRGRQVLPMSRVRCWNSSAPPSSSRRKPQRSAIMALL